MKYVIKFTPLAIEDLDQIFIYIAFELCNNTAAENLTLKIENRINRLKTFPYHCSQVTDEILKFKGYRKLIVDNYIVFYLVDEKSKEVVIMRILFGARI